MRKTAPSLYFILMAALTFLIPAGQWLAGKLAPAVVSGAITSLLVILFAVSVGSLLKTAALIPPSPLWKMACYLPGSFIGVLLITNILNHPVAKITGIARTPFEVVDAIVFLPMAEELIFRGVLWAVVDKFSRNGKRYYLALAVTAVLFGAEHLGYWAQTDWPLPVNAYLHTLSMVLAGACFGAIRLKSRSLAAPAVVHMLANGLILLTQ